MRRFAAVTVVLLTAMPAWAQEWREYVSRQDRFSISIPAEPAVRETLYETEYEIVLPSRIYSIEDGGATYSVTAVDWHAAEKVHEARFATCRAAGSQACATSWRDEVRGAVLHAAAAFLARGSDVTYFGMNTVDGVEGIGIELLNRDESRTAAVVYWHEHRLYVAEATAPDGHSAPDAFPASLGFIDEQGRKVRYGGPYSPLFPAPPRVW